MPKRVATDTGGDESPPTSPVASTSQPLSRDATSAGSSSTPISAPGSPVLDAPSPISEAPVFDALTDPSEPASPSEYGPFTNTVASPAGSTSSLVSTIVLEGPVVVDVAASAPTTPGTKAAADLGPSAVLPQSASDPEPARASSPLGLGLIVDGGEKVDGVESADGAEDGESSAGSGFEGPEVNGLGLEGLEFGAMPGVFGGPAVAVDHARISPLPLLQRAPAVPQPLLGYPQQKFWTPQPILRRMPMLHQHQPFYAQHPWYSAPLPLQQLQTVQQHFQPVGYPYPQHMQHLDYQYLQPQLQPQPLPSLTLPLPDVSEDVAPQTNWPPLPKEALLPENNLQLWGNWNQSL